MYVCMYVIAVYFVKGVMFNLANCQNHTIKSITALALSGKIWLRTADYFFVNSPESSTATIIVTILL